MAIEETNFLEDMAKRKKNLGFFGYKSDDVSSESVIILGKLLCTLVYNEVPKTSEILSSLDFENVSEIQKAAERLALLCDVVNYDI